MCYIVNVSMYIEANLKSRVALDSSVRVSLISYNSIRNDHFVSTKTQGRRTFYDEDCESRSQGI